MYFPYDGDGDGDGDVDVDVDVDAGAGYHIYYTRSFQVRFEAEAFLSKHHFDPDLCLYWHNVCVLRDRGYTLHVQFVYSGGCSRNKL